MTLQFCSYRTALLSQMCAQNVNVGHKSALKTSVADPGPEGKFPTKSVSVGKISD